jgi:hypothetical protein
MKVWIVIVLIQTFFSINHSSSEQRINCMIFIDGKLPEGSYIYNSYFTYTNNDGSLLQVGFNYVIGDIIINIDDLEILKSLNSNDLIELEFTWKKFDGKTFTYRGEIEQHDLFYDYLIIRITNLNKKKGKYYFGYSTPFSSSGFINKEHNIFMNYTE